MNGKTIQTNSGRSFRSSGALATIALLGGTLMATGAAPTLALAQSDAAVSARATAAPAGAATMRIPGSAQPIISHIAEMWVAANQRANDKSTAEGSRESYRAAATALRQALASAHVRPTGRGGSRYNADLLISSGQLSDDIGQIRAMTSHMSGPRVADLNQVAALYATGAKEFFTGLMRDALLGSTSSGGRLAANGSGTSGDLGITSRRPNTTVPVMPLPDVQPGALPNVSLDTYGFAPDSTYWGPGAIVGGGGFGNTVLMGPGGVANVPPAVNTVPVDGNPAPTVGVPPNTQP